jgi:CHASE2 domain-containing sensor protein/signal transduction histidine kinase
MPDLNPRRPPQPRVPRPAARAALREWRVLTLLLVLAAALAGHAGGLGRPDLTLYDAALGSMPHAPSPAVIIVAIDDRSLAQIGRWPWPRATHAALLEKIAAAAPKAIGLDLLLSEPEPAGAAGRGTGERGPGDRGTGERGPGDRGDAALARALAQAGRVVLPVMMQARGPERLGLWRTALPVPALAAAAAGLGHIHVEIDQDGIARSVFLREGLGSADALAHGAPGGWPHFALALRELGDAAQPAALPGERNPHPEGPGAQAWARDYWIQIPYAGPPGTFEQVSYADVLQGLVPAERFAGKYVLIGATAAGLSDAFPTPVSGLSRPMPGIEISANVLAALLENRAIVRAGPWANCAFSALAVLLLLLGLLVLSPRRGLLLAGALLAATLAVAFLALRFAGVWFAPSAALACLILAYPLWSWRRLEATLKYLGDELIRLDAEPRLLPGTAPDRAAPGADLVERRILAVEAAALRLRQARRFVSDTLESLPDAALVTDHQGSVLLANRAAARVFNVAAAGMLRGRGVADLLAAFTPKIAHASAPTWEQVQALAAGPAPPPATAATEGTGEPARLPATAAAERTGEPAKLPATAAAERTGEPAKLPATAAAERTGEPAKLPATAAADEATQPAALELASPGGAELLVRCSACEDGTGTAIGAIVSLVDISQLRAAERRRDEVLAFLSHDMRSPQSSILALLELHELDPEDNPVDTVHQRIAQYARRTLELSEQFLQLARAETKEYDFDTVDLGPVAEEAVEESWAAAEQKHITLELRFDGEPVPVRADIALLRRALINLVSNAVKYSPEDTTVTVEVAARAGWQVCSVADQGYGISPADLRQLFGRFRRFAAPGQPKAQGAGLGMSFVKTVVDKHGGHIDVESALGAGSRFTIRLPPAAS